LAAAAWAAFSLRSWHSEPPFPRRTARLDQRRLRLFQCNPQTGDLALGYWQPSRRNFSISASLAHRPLQGNLLLRRRGHHLAQHLLQRGAVIRQGDEVNRNAATMIGVSASVSMIPA
jgi:hypothetical protein